MLKKLMLLVFVSMLLSPAIADAYGAAHVGYTHVGPNGVQHYGASAYRGPYGSGSSAHGSAYGYNDGAYHAGYGESSRYGNSGGYHYSGGYNSGGSYHYHYNYMR